MFALPEPANALTGRRETVAVGPSMCQQQGDDVGVRLVIWTVDAERFDGPEDAAA